MLLGHEFSEENCKNKCYVLLKITVWTACFFTSVMCTCVKKNKNGILNGSNSHLAMKTKCLLLNHLGITMCVHVLTCRRVIIKCIAK